MHSHSGGETPVSAVTVSIAICTRNRAAMLRETLEALARVHVPAALPAEVLVVDNASTDATHEVVGAWQPAGLARRYVREERPGVANCRNTALALAEGAVIVFLDDDVRPAGGWLAPMCGPIVAGEADAVAGGVRLAAHLHRPWMEPIHLAWLAATDFIDPHSPAEMVSANMAVGRHVLSRVPGFDPELGPGALGQGEDALFSWQLRRAGFRIAPALDVAVEHHFDPSRLLYRSFRDTAERRGATLAYQRHHWEHQEVPGARARWRRRWVRLALERVRHWRPGPRREGMAPAEMLAWESVAFLRAWPNERRRPRNYERFGLVRRDHGMR